MYVFEFYAPTNMRPNGPKNWDDEWNMYHIVGKHCARKACTRPGRWWCGFDDASNLSYAYDMLGEYALQSFGILDPLHLLEKKAPHAKDQALVTRAGENMEMIRNHTLFFFGNSSDDVDVRIQSVVAMLGRRLGGKLEKNPNTLFLLEMYLMLSWLSLTSSNAALTTFVNTHTQSM